MVHHIQNRQMSARYIHRRLGYCHNPLIPSQDDDLGASLYDVRKPGEKLIKYGKRRGPAMFARFDSRGEKVLVIARRRNPEVFTLRDTSPLCRYGRKRMACLGRQIQNPHRGGHFATPSFSVLVTVQQFGEKMLVVAIPVASAAASTRPDTTTTAQ